MFKKLVPYILSFIAGVLAVYGYIMNNKKANVKPVDVFIKKTEDDLKEINKKQEKLKKDGVPDKTAQEEIDYWKNN